MNIGIVGAGHIGGTLTRRLTALGHKVFVANLEARKRSAIWRHKLERRRSPRKRRLAAETW